MGDVYRIFVCIIMVLQKSKNTFTYIFGIFSFLILSAFLGTSCENIYEEPSDNVNEAVDFSLALHTPISLVEIIEHINSELLNKGLFKVQADSLSLQLGATVSVLDSIFVDDDSIIYEINFPGNLPSMLDRKVRKGTIQVAINFNYTEVGGLYNVKILDANPYQLNLPDGSIFTMKGNFEIERLLNDRYKVNLDKLKIEAETTTGLKLFECQGNLNYHNITGQQIPGLVGDVLEFEGAGNWKNEKSTYNWNVTLPLQLRYDYGCSDYANKGIVVLIKDFNRYNIDFDPFGTGACNRIVNITKGGSAFEITLP